MKKLLNVTILEMIPDWSTTTLNAGIYFDENSRNLFFYSGNHQYPSIFWIEPTFAFEWQEKTELMTAEIKSTSQSILIPDIVKLRDLTCKHESARREIK